MGKNSLFIHFSDFFVLVNTINSFLEETQAHPFSFFLFWNLLQTGPRVPPTPLLSVDIYFTYMITVFLMFIFALYPLGQS